MLPVNHPAKEEIKKDIEKETSKFSFSEINNIINKTTQIYEFHSFVNSQAQAQIIIKRFEENVVHGKKHNYQAPNNTVLANILAQTKNCNENFVEKISSCITLKDEALIWLVESLPQRLDLPKEGHKLVENIGHLMEEYISHRPGRLGKIHRKVARSNVINSTIQNIFEFNKRFDACESIQDISNCKNNQRHGPTLENQQDELVHLIINKISNQVEDQEGNFTGHKEVKTPKLYQELQEKNSDEIYSVIVPLVGKKEFTIDKSNEITCEGETFSPEIRNLVSYGADKGMFGMRNETAFKNINRDQMIKKNNANDALKLNGRDKVKKLTDFFAKVGIQGPFFRCFPEPVLKAPTFALRSAEKLVCCEDKKDWRKLKYGFLNIQTGFSCRGFFGIPYVAEIGVKAGVDAKLSFGGGIEPEQCLPQMCGSGTFRLGVSGALYAEAFAGVGAIQGTLSWGPYVAAKQCFANEGADPPMDIHFSPKIVTAAFSVQLGWAFRKDYIKVLYKDNNNYEHEISLF